MPADRLAIVELHADFPADHRFILGHELCCGSLIAGADAGYEFRKQHLVGRVAFSVDFCHLPVPA